MKTLLDKVSCNVSEDTNRWNQTTLFYKPFPIYVPIESSPQQRPTGWQCNLSQDTLKWNRLCLNYSA